MRITAIALLVAGLGTVSAHAQTPAQTPATPGYELQKARLKAARLDSLASLRVLGKGGVGKIIELKGQIKGSFAHEGSRTLLVQIGAGEKVTVEASDAFKTVPATFSGANSRFLCRVEPPLGTENAEVALILLAASDAPEPVQLFKTDDLDAVVAPPDGQSLPAPDQIVIGADSGDFAAIGNAPPVKIIVGGGNSIASAPRTPSGSVTRSSAQTRNGAQTRSSAQTRSTARRAGQTRTGNRLPARSLPRSAQSARAAQPVSPYFGFDESQRAAYKSLARRNNPRLGDAMADNIATSILMAAQTHRLDPRFLAAIVTVESSFDPYCLSSSGAMGLGQLMPFNLRPLGVANAWDPAQNLNGSAKLLRQNLDTYARQPNGTLLAVAAYHAGVGAVNRAGKAVPPRASTQKYVWKVYYAYRALAPELFR